jgi:glutamine kinase
MKIIENHFTSKANVLKFLQTKLKKSKIEEIFIFSVNDWKTNKHEILSNIQAQFNRKKIIVRSSAIGEDSIEKSSAGAYESILDVMTNSKEEISKSVNSVIRSYQKNNNYNKNNQILIQNQTSKIKLSGVIFTKTQDIGAPYFVINYEEGSSTDGVTKGLVNESVKLFRKTPSQLIPKKWKKLILSIKEIELKINSNLLDIEFGITKNDEIVIFQVRPITSLNNQKIKNNEPIILKSIENNLKKFLDFNNGKNQNKVIFSDMSDWNPSEIIGDNPKLLDYSLYDFLIMEKNWHLGRKEIGYKNMKNSPLMEKFGNKPYVNIRSSFNSLIPDNIPENLKKKIMQFYIKKLEKNPFLHDKIEFEILFTCYDFTLNKRIRELKKYGFTEREINKIKDNLKEFTNNVIEEFPNILNESKKSIEQLTTNRNLVHENLIGNTKQFDKIQAIEKLLEDCKNFGTLPFSKMARISFISSILLKTIAKDNKILKEFSKKFFFSIDTPISQIQNDAELLTKKKITKKEFLKKYGHLRPGTYDITVPRYDSENKIFDTIKFLKKSKTRKLHINEKYLNKILKNHGLKFEKMSFLNFIRESISGRENLKFEFTKNLSDVIELISSVGKELGFSKDELSYLDIKIILQSKNQTQEKTKQIWEKNIKKIKKNTENNNLILLPPLLSSKNDFYYLQYYISKPNFITSKKISGEVVNLIKNNKNQLELENKIILIEHADPGYDWIFTKKPKALITKYGGVASHMSIRCHEMNLPAAIGCGEILYEKLLNASKVLIDCENKQVITLIDKVTDEDMQIKKVLKSLGYTK